MAGSASARAVASRRARRASRRIKSSARERTAEYSNPRFAMSWLRRQNLTKASCTMSSASAADCTHWRANRSNPGATSEKQFLQFSWLAMDSMTFSRSLLSRRRQVEILSSTRNIWSVAENKTWGSLAAALAAVAPGQLMFLELRAELGFRASPGVRPRSDRLEVIQQTNS